jgi:hypothetical protein
MHRHRSNQDAADDLQLHVGPVAVLVVSTAGQSQMRERVNPWFLLSSTLELGVHH